jgi:hypothetical protein
MFTKVLMLVEVGILRKAVHTTIVESLLRKAVRFARHKETSNWLHRPDVGLKSIWYYGWSRKPWIKLGKIYGLGLPLVGPRTMLGVISAKQKR